MTTSLLISVDRTSLSLPDFVFSGMEDSNTWGILPGFVPPGFVPRETLVSSPFTHGEVLTHWTWQSAFLSFQAFPAVASGPDLKAAVAELKAAIGRTAFDVTVDFNGGADVWECRVGSVEPSPIDLPELTNNAPIYSITIPCYPVPS